MTNFAQSGPAEATWRIIAVLAFAVFAVSLGYGVLLPILPEVVRRIAGQDDPGLVARHIGLITGTFAGAPIVFAPLWGSLSDRIGSKRVALIGLLGFAATSITPPIETSLWAVHAARLVNGAFASAVTPAALAIILEHTGAEIRARGFASIGIASIAGYFVGPILGGWLMAAPPQPAGSAVLAWLPLVASAGLTLVASLLVHITFNGDARTISTLVRPVAGSRSLSRILLALAASAAGSLAAFEVGIVVHMQNSGFGTERLAVIFAVCSFVMLIAQAIVFSPLAEPRWMRLMIAPAFLTMAAALLLTPPTSGFLASVVATAVIAAAGGLVIPLLSYWLSFASQLGHGVEQGRRTAVISLGQAGGSVVAGFLSGPDLLADAPFRVAAAVAAVSGLVAAILQSRLAVFEAAAGRHELLGREPKVE